jgi:hypothetical protein
VSPYCHKQVASGQFLDAEEYGESEQGEPGELFGAFAQRFVQACSESESDLGEQECLGADEDDGEPEGKVE